MFEFIDDIYMDEYRKKLQSLLDLDEGLMDIEVDFICSLEEDWEGNFTLKQADWLDRIHERLFG